MSGIIVQATVTAASVNQKIRRPRRFRRELSLIKNTEKNEIHINLKQVERDVGFCTLQECFC